MEGQGAAPTPTPPPSLGEGPGERATRLPSLAFIGAGKVGTALSACLAELGYPVTAVYSRTPEHAAALAAALPDCGAAATPAEAAAVADVVFLTVPDSAVAAVAAAVPWRRGQAAVHCGGALGLSPLAPARRAGARAGCLHPLYPCADAQSAHWGLRRCSYAVIADAELQPVLGDMAVRLSGRWFPLPEEWVPLYHAGASLASNFSVALASLAVELWRRCGLSHDDAVQAVATLMEGTAANLSSRGLPDALTGPMVRGDATTVGLHLEALEAAAPELLPLYRELGRQTLALAARRGLGEQRRREVEGMLLGRAPAPRDLSSGPFPAREGELTTPRHAKLPSPRGGGTEGEVSMRARGVVMEQRVNPVKAGLAREYRRHMTPAEQTLWRSLRANRLNGLHFRRQQVIDGFIVDFYCHAVGLVIEVDGPVHQRQAEYDHERDRALNRRGLRIVRATNEQVLRDLPAVLAVIASTAKDLSPDRFPAREGELTPSHQAHKLPSPRRGGNEGEVRPLPGQTTTTQEAR